MTKVYSLSKSTGGVFVPLPTDQHHQEKSWVEKFAIRWLKVAIISLVLTMMFLVITQQLLNQELTAENERLRKLSSHRVVDNELLAHPYFEKYGDAFETFKKKYDKAYDNLHEEHRRKLIFLNNMQEIDQLNNDERNLLGNEYEATQFADLTDTEFKQMLLPIDYYSKMRKHSTFLRPFESHLMDTAVNRPPRFDWREKGVVTPVKAQGNCGSCWAFATTATVESAYAVAHGQLRNLSEQELLDCNMENNACDGGDLDKSFRFVHDKGLTYEDSYPYVAHRQNSCSLTPESKIIKIDFAYWLNPTEDAIIDWLLTYGPVNVGISVPSSMKHYKSGVYNPSPWECQFDVLGTHALLVVGYGTTDEGEKYYIVKNSWGQKYGIENGYVYMARGVNSCGIEDEPIGILA